MEELKARSFRITEETSERIKELASEIGGNQQEVMAKLIEAYELQKGKYVLTDKRGDIEKFEQYTAIITRMYMASLEENQNITATVRVDYESQLLSKDQIIQNLQEENKNLKQEKSELVNQTKSIQTENDSLRHELDANRHEAEEKKNIYDNTIKDKEGLNYALSITTKDLKERLKKTEQSISEAAIIKKNQQELEDKLQMAENTVKETESHLNSKLQKVELETERKILALSKAHQEEILKIKLEHQGEIDKYQEKYLALLEKMQTKEETKPAPKRTRTPSKKPTANLENDSEGQKDKPSK
jgi:hypothetical protein